MKIEIVTVTRTKAKFRLLSSDGKESQEAELEPSMSQELWLNGGMVGVRIRVDKIRPI